MKKDKAKKIQYDIKVEAMVPSTLTFKVIAENEIEAIKQIEKQSPKQFLPHLSRKIKLKATVYKSGSSIIQITKYYGK